MRDRVWSLDIDGKPFIDKQTGTRQFRITFDIQINPGNTLSLADIRIYNLRKDNKIAQGAPIILRAGYTDAYDVVFTGYITNVFPEREGAEIITRLICKSGDPNTDRGSANGSYGKNAKVVDVIKDLARSWPRALDIDESQFESAPVFTSGFVADGDIPTILDKLGNQFDFDWSQDRGRLIISKRNMKRKTMITDVNKFTGMIGIPEVTKGPNGFGVFIVNTLNPYFRINGRINLKSEFSTFNTGNLYMVQLGGDATANGEYNIFQLRYRGDSHGNQWETEIDALRADIPETTTPNVSTSTLIWGKRVDIEFRKKVREVAGKLGFDANWLMAVMAFETGRTFSPSKKNPYGSATGLIQFVESTAKSLGTTTAALARMSSVEQLDYVEKYFRPYKSQIKNLGDCYMAVLWPRAIGKADSYVLWTSGSREYDANSGLDTNRDGKITRAEAVSRVNKEMTDGLKFAK